MRFWPKTVSNEFMSDGRQYEKVVELSADVALSGAATVELAPIVELAAPSAGTQTAALKAASLLMRKDSFESEGSGRGGVRQRGAASSMQSSELTVSFVRPTLSSALPQPALTDWKTVSYVVALQSGARQ